MITPERRRLRRDIYNALDPERTLQPVGYDYLAEDENAVLEEIPQGREFRPAYRDDGGTWTMDRENIASLRTPAF